MGNLWLLILTHSFFRDVFIFLTVYNSFYLLCVSRVCKSLICVRLFATPWTVAHQAPLSMEFSRQEYWSRLPFPSPGDLPNQESNPCLLHCRQIPYHLSYREVLFYLLLNIKYALIKHQIPDDILKSSLLS